MGPSPLQRNPGESEPPPRTVSDELIARLIELRAPHLAHLPIGRRYDDAEDHVSVRIGEEHGAAFPTLPRMPSYHPVAMAHLRAAAPSWGFTAQVPLLIGGPALGYGSHFAVYPWIDASNALHAPLTLESAHSLGQALAAVHQPAPADAPQHAHIQVPLTWQSELVYDLIDTVHSLLSPEGLRLEVAAARHLWDSALDFLSTTAETWIHAALDPRLILSDGGRFAGILHWREFSRGDPALDLGFAASALTPAGVESMLDGYGATRTAKLNIQLEGARMVRGLRFITSGNPALARLGWTRLQETEVLRHD